MNELETFFGEKPRKYMLTPKIDNVTVAHGISDGLVFPPIYFEPTEFTGPGRSIEEQRGKQEERRQVPKEATKYDADKIDYSLLSDDALQEISKVFMFGAKKYARWNYTQSNGMDWMRLWKSLARHIFAWKRGQDNDPESGLSHLAHAGCCIIMLLHYAKNSKKYDRDDRYTY